MGCSPPHLTLRRRQGSHEKALFLVALAELALATVFSALMLVLPLPLLLLLPPLLLLLLLLVELEAFPVADDMIAAGKGVGWSDGRPRPGAVAAVRVVSSSDSARGRIRAAAEPHRRYSGSDEIWPDREEVSEELSCGGASRPSKIHRGPFRCFCLEGSPVSSPASPFKSSLFFRFSVFCFFIYFRPPMYMGRSVMEGAGTETAATHSYNYGVTENPHTYICSFVSTLRGVFVCACVYLCDNTTRVTM